MKTTLLVHVVVDGCDEVKSPLSTARMIRFHGRAESDFFNGEILPGGVDTQREYRDNPFSLSARYMLKGKDKDGKDCRLFIENNGTATDGVVTTSPILVSDSPSLAWLETARTSGSISDKNGELLITIQIEAD